MEQTAPAPAIVPVFPGLDVSAWDGKLVWLWRWSNLRFAGFYLAHHAGQARTTWTDHWHDLQDLGWGLVPFYLPFSSGGIAGMSAADGTAHGREAVALARGARIEAGAAIYLDIEAPVLGAGADPGFARYINNWFAAVRAGGYTPGTYCSRLDASAILGGAFRANHPVLFPFSIPKRTRAQWDDDRHELVAPLPATWDVGRDPAWAPDASTIGCQYRLVQWAARSHGVPLADAHRCEWHRPQRRLGRSEGLEPLASARRRRRRRRGRPGY